MFKVGQSPYKQRCFCFFIFFVQLWRGERGWRPLLWAKDGALTLQRFTDTWWSSCQTTQDHVSSEFRYAACRPAFVRRLLFGPPRDIHVITALVCRVLWTSQARSSTWRRRWWRRASTPIRSRTRCIFWMKKSRITSHSRQRYSLRLHQGRSKFRLRDYMSCSRHTAVDFIFVILLDAQLFNFDISCFFFSLNDLIKCNKKKAGHRRTLSRCILSYLKSNNKASFPSWENQEVVVQQSVPHPSLFSDLNDWMKEWMEQWRVW